MYENKYFSIFIIHWSISVYAPKMLLYKHSGSSQLCKYGYDCHVKEESEFCGSYLILNPNPRANKQTMAHQIIHCFMQNIVYIDHLDTVHYFGKSYKILNCSAELTIAFHCSEIASLSDWTSRQSKNLKKESKLLTRAFQITYFILILVYRWIRFSKKIILWQFLGSKPLL